MMEKSLRAKMFFCGILCIWVVIAPCMFAGFAGMSMDAEFTPPEEEGLTLLESSHLVQYASGRQEEFAAGEALPRVAAAGHPLGEIPAMVLPREEIAVLPANCHADSSTGYVLDDSYGGFAELRTFPYPSQYLDQSHIVKGDFDGDGRDELLGTANCLVKLWDDSTNNFVQTWSHQFNYPSGLWRDLLAAGDFDGDGVDEFVLLVVYPGVLTSYARWYVYDIQDQQQLFDSGEWMEAINDWDTGHANIDTGDFDGDGRDEIVIVFSNFYWGFVLDDALSSPAFNQMYYTAGNPDWASGIFIDTEETLLQTGDIDGDGMDEIISSVGWMPPSATQEFYVRNWNGITIIKNVYALPAGFTLKEKMKAGDLDGDGLIELLFYNNCDPEWFLILDDQLANFATLRAWGPSVSPPSYMLCCDFDVGDVDCDGVDEVVFANNGQTTVLDDANHGFALLKEDTNHKTGILHHPAPCCDAYVLVGNFDGDGAELTYTGESWSTTSPPGILLALAAPPYYRGIEMNLADTFTSYGTTSTRGSSTDNTVGTTSGWSLTVEAEVGLGGDGGWCGGFSASYGYAVQEALARKDTITQVTSSSTKFSSGCSDNGVIFQLTNYDHYRYTVSSHPNASLVGTLMTIAIPHAPLIYKTTVNYFNRVFPEAPKIGAETFNHTVGQPWTYLNLTQAAQKWPNRWQSAEQTVGLGTAENSVLIETGNESAVTLSKSWASTHTISTSASAGYGVFSLKITKGWSWGETTDQAFTTTVGNAVLFEGSIGDIAKEEDFATLNFSYTLFIHDVKRENDVTYRVVNYWVSGARVYTPPLLDIILSSAAPFAACSIMTIIPFSMALRARRGKGRASKGSTRRATTRKKK